MVMAGAGGEGARTISSAKPETTSSRNVDVFRQAEFNVAVLPALH